MFDSRRIIRKILLYKNFFNYLNSHSRGVSPACIPFSYQGYNLNDGTTVVAVGFGATEFGLDEEYDTKSWTLQRVNLQKDSKLAADCNGTVFCAKGVVSGDLRGDTCTRDSGGPVYLWLKNRAHIFGIISRGLDCGSFSSFSYNTYIPSFLSWIQTQTSGSFLCNY